MMTVEQACAVIRKCQQQHFFFACVSLAVGAICLYVSVLCYQSGMWFPMVLNIFSTALEPAPSFCQHCGYFVDCATEALGGKSRPDPGDFSICLSCGGINRFTADMRLRKLTAIDQVPDYIKAILEKCERARREVVPREGLQKRQTKQ